MTDTGSGAGWAQPGSSNEAGSAKDMAKDALDTVKQEAASFAADAKDKAIGQVEDHKATAVQTLTDFADAVRKAGDELANKDQSVAGRLVRHAADSLENVSRAVSDKRPEELLETVREFGRNNPTALIAGSVLAGLALGRFLRSSAPEGGAGRSFTGGMGAAPGGAPAAQPLPGDDFHSDEGADLSAHSATGAGGGDIGVTGDDRGSLDTGGPQFRGSSV